jgi:ABC-type antimicrobial peptide transport system permease subunit
MSSFSAGSKQKQADQIRALGSNLIRIIDRRLEENALFSARAQGSAGLRREDADTLAEVVNELQAITMVRNMDLEVEVERNPVPEAQVRGVKGQYLQVNNLELAQGTFIEEADQTRSNRVAVIGNGVIPDGMSPEDALSATLRIGGQPYRVIGVLANRFVDTTELEAVGANDSNLDILVPLVTVLNRYTHQPLRSELDEIQLQLTEEDKLATAGQQIRRVLEALHRGVDDFELVIPLDLLKSKQESQKLLDILSLCISAISLVVGGIGIMNIMLASVTERLKEIGIRRAVGARAEDIRNQFLVESVLLSMAGGVAGVVLALIGVALASVPLSIPIVYEPGIMLVAFGAAFSTGLGFGAYPAIRASKENLVDILSRE